MAKCLSNMHKAPCLILIPVNLLGYCVPFLQDEWRISLSS